MHHTCVEHYIHGITNGASGAVQGGVQVKGIGAYTRQGVKASPTCAGNCAGGMCGRKHRTMHILLFRLLQQSLQELASDTTTKQQRPQPPVLTNAVVGCAAGSASHFKRTIAVRQIQKHNSSGSPVLGTALVGCVAGSALRRRTQHGRQVAPR
jgi:hypothetical protein